MARTHSDNIRERIAHLRQLRADLLEKEAFAATDAYRVRTRRWIREVEIELIRWLSLEEEAAT